MPYVKLSQQTASSAPRLPGVVQDIHLPPLRELGDDLPLLVHHDLRRFSRELGREVHEIAPEALERLRGSASGTAPTPATCMRRPTGG